MTYFLPLPPDFFLLHRTVAGEYNRKNKLFARSHIARLQAKHASVVVYTERFLRRFNQIVIFFL